MSPGLTTRLDLLFIHHSCGGQLLAEAGVDDGECCIYKTHPNGGGLRTRLQQNGYIVHEASYGSRIGQATDLFDWLPKFRGQMDKILACDSQDIPLPGDRRNRIVIFKSCFPNNQFQSRGTPPGNPEGPQLTIWNAKATYTALLREFRKQQDVLFVCMTTPPVAAGVSPEPLWKTLARRILGRGVSPVVRASLSRQFNSWVRTPEGWLNEYPLENVVVFDLYNILTGLGHSDFSVYPTGGGHDSHPSREGNTKAAEAFVPFLNQAVGRMPYAQSLPFGAEKTKA